MKFGRALEKLHYGRKDGVHYIKTGEHKDELIALLLAVEELGKEPS